VSAAATTMPWLFALGGLALVGLCWIALLPGALQGLWPRRAAVAPLRASPTLALGLGAGLLLWTGAMYLSIGNPAALRPPAMPDADALTEDAVTLAIRQGDRLAGAPEALIRLALLQQPDHAAALALAGSARFEQGDFAGALAAWRHLLAVAPADSRLRAEIAGNVAEAEAALAQR